MSFLAENKGTGELAPAGMHLARCISLIDLGTHVSEMYNRANRKLSVGWELPNESRKKGDFAGKPFILAKWYTLSWGEKANLRIMIQTWRGKPFSGEETKAFQISKILGQPCMLSVNHEHKNGNDRAIITAVTPIPKEMACPEQITPILKFSLDEFDQQIFESLSDGVKKHIMQSPEYKRLSEPIEPAAMEHTNMGPSHDDFDDDVPF